MRFNVWVKNTFLCIIIITTSLILHSCARRVAFLSSSVVPAARGNVEVKKDRKNNNYVIDIDILHLAESEKLQPPKNTYVVWMVTEDSTTKNIGQIKSSSSELLSKALKASLRTVSSFKPTKIFITAEDDGSIQLPGPQVVLSTSSFQLR